MSEIVLIIALLILLGLVLYLFITYRKYREWQQKNKLLNNAIELPDEVMLKRPIALISRNEQRSLKVIIFLFPVLFILMFASVLVINVNTSVELVAKLHKLVESDLQLLTGMLLVLIFTIIYPVILHKTVHNESLNLSKQGISYQSIGSLVFDIFMPSWSMNWEDIAKARLDKVGIQGSLQLTDRLGNKKRLIVNQWLLPKDDKNHSSIFSQFWQATELQKNPDAILEFPLIKFIKTKTHIDLEYSPSTLGFDLMSHPKTKTLLFLIAGIGIYTIIDAALNMETYLVTPPIWWFVIGGLIAGFFAFLKIQDKNIPSSNAIGVGVIFALVSGIALYPGLLRINQISDPYGLRTYEYQMHNDGIFRNVDTSLPEIKMSPDKYWHSIETGETYSFRLRKGGLDFYQIDMGDVYANMRKWYCQQDKEHPTDIKVGCD